MLKVSREVMEMFGVLVPVGAREYLPLKFSVKRKKELRLMYNSCLMYCIEYAILFVFYFSFLDKFAIYS